MVENLVETINSLSPAARQVLAKKIQMLPERQKQLALNRLRGLNIQTSTQTSIQQNTPSVQQQRIPSAQSDIPLWQKAVSTVTKPFQWIDEYVTKPFGAIVTSPFTPSTAGTQGMNWLEREKAEYKAWDDPNWGFIGAKGAVETLPWLLVPSAAGVAGRLGSLAAKAGTIGKIASVGAKIAKPIATAERIATYPIAKPLEMAGSAIAKAATGKFTALSSAEIEKQLTKPDWMRSFATKFGNTPIAKSIIKAVGGKAANVTEAEGDTAIRAILVGIRAQESLLSKGQSTLGSLRVISDNPIRLFGVDEATGIAGRVSAKVSGASKHIADIAEHPANYILSSPQKQYINKLHEIEDWVLQGLKEEGIEVNELKFDEFSHWVHRQVIGKNIDDALAKVTPSIGRRVGSKASWEKTRFYETAAEGVKAGLLYEPSLDKVLNLYVQSAAKRISDQRIANMVAPLGQKALERAWKQAPQIMKTAQETTSQLAGAKQLQRVINRAIRGETLPEATLAAQERKFPGMAQKLKDAMGNTDKLKQLSTEAKQLEQGAKAPYWQAKAVRTKAMEIARTPSLGTEATIQHPAFQGKIYPKEVADTINKYWNDTGFGLLNSAATLSGEMRTLVAAADFSAMFIQGLPSIALHPKEWAKAAVMSLSSFIKPKIYQEYLAKNEASFMERGHFLGYIGGFEYMEAMPALQKTAGAVTKFVTKKPQIGKEAVRQTYGRFEASFGSFGDVVRNEMWLALKGKAKNTSELQEIARHIDRMTGVMSQKGLGIGKTQRDFEQAFVFFAPRYTRAGFALVGDTLKGGITGNEARKALGSMMAAVYFMYGGICKALGQEPNFDPSSAKFMTVEITDPMTGTTRHMGIGGMMTSLTRFAADVTASMIGMGGNEPLDLVKLNRFDNPFIKFMYSKTAPLTGVIEELREGTNYFGEPFETKADYAKYIGEKIMPIALQSAVMEEGGFSPTAIIAEEAGLRTFPRSDWEKRDIIREQLAQAKYKMSWNEVGQKIGELGQRQLEMSSPELQSATARANETSTKMARGEGKVWDMRKKESQSIEDAYRKEITLASHEFEATKNGQNFRDRVDAASNARRVAYARMETDPKYKEVYDYFNQPLSPQAMANMSPNDRARREYYQTMFSPDMYDQYGNYRFDEANAREAQFIQKYGQAALDYIDEFSASTWDEPIPLKALREARQLLEPYWGIEDKIWAMYPPQLKVVSDQAKVMEDNDPLQARKLLMRHPQILRARELIAIYKKRYMIQHPTIKKVYNLFY